MVVGVGEGEGEGVGGVWVGVALVGGNAGWVVEIAGEEIVEVAGAVEQAASIRVKSKVAMINK